MKLVLIVLAVTIAGLSAASVAEGHRHAGRLDVSPVLEVEVFPEPEMSAAEQRAYRRFVRKVNRLVKARAAHWSYTWQQVQTNLKATNMDRACGYGANQYCRQDSMGSGWRAWVGDHSIRAEVQWSQYTYCLPGCDVWDHCAALVRVVDHNDGGRVNIREIYSWTHRESSCQIPVGQVP